MRHYITTLIIFYICTIPLSAQEEKQYVRVNQSTVNDVIEKMMDKQDDIDAVQKGWAENLLRAAFQSYFSNKKTKAKVYEQSVIKFYQDSITKLNSTIKNNDKAIQSLQNQVLKENVNARIDVVKKKMSDSLNHVLSVKESNIIRQEGCIDSLNKIILQLERERTELKHGAKIAENVTKHYVTKQQAIETLYMEYKNSQTMEYINCEQISQSISEYTDYLKIIDVPMPDEQKKQVEYLQAISAMGEIYISAISLLESKYDKASVAKWNEDYKKKRVFVEKLNDGQKTIIAQIENAVNTLEVAVTHFKNSIVAYLVEQGQIPDVETAENIREMLALKVENFSSVRQYKDVSKYDPYHKRLNDILKKTRDGIKIMNEATYKSFISNIEKDL